MVGETVAEIDSSKTPAEMLNSAIRYIAVCGKKI
jgi:hypothetical protein